MDIRAKIYSPETLKVDVREAIHDGIDMVLTYMGQTALKQEVVTSSLRSPSGTINPDRISYKRLDKLVELHVVAVPFKQEVGANGQYIVSGQAVLAGGCAAVDTLGNASKIRNTTSHEVAHALGYVSADNEDQRSANHCSNDECIMHAVAEAYIPRPSSLEQAISMLSNYDLASTYNNPSLRVKQHDFCLDCKMDMRDTGQKHIEDLHYLRVIKSIIGL